MADFWEERTAGHLGCGPGLMEHRRPMWLTVVTYSGVQGTLCTAGVYTVISYIQSKCLPPYISAPCIEIEALWGATRGKGGLRTPHKGLNITPGSLVLSEVPIKPSQLLEHFQGSPREIPWGPPLLPFPHLPFRRWEDDREGSGTRALTVQTLGSDLGVWGTLSSAFQHG